MSADGMSARGEVDPRNESAAAGTDGASPYRGGRPTRDGATSHRVRTWIALAALAFYALFVFRTSFSIGGTRYFVLFEDAMISMRYARHLADGHGLVWNIGEAPIEGFTNLLWVLWMSVAHKLGLAESKISLFIMLSGVAILLATGLVTSKIARKVSPAPWVPVFVLAATLFDYPLVFWTLRGMEVGALTLAVYTLLWLALENEEEFSVPRTLAMGALTSMALLIRSDSVVPVGLITLYGFLTCSRRWLFAAIIGAFAGAAVGGQTTFRKAYFHESLPNTYFLKLYKISTLARIKRGAFVALEVLALHLAVPISIVLASLPGVTPSIAWVKEVWSDRASRRLVLFGAIFSAQVGYATYVGGDAWEWMLYANRYMCVGMPALIVLVAVLAERAIALGSASAAFVSRLSYALAACGLLLVALNLFARMFPEEGIAATIVFSKTPFAAGGAMVLAGVLLRMKDARTGLVEGLDALRRMLGSQKTVTRAALIVAALVWLPSHLLPLGRWAAQNAAQYADEARYTRLGLLIQANTTPDFRIAVAAAGATPYFAQRPTEDLLGKNDRHVAKLPPRGVFSPGHDKWDYGYSLGERNAQLVVEAVDVNDADERYMKELGFEELPNGMRLRKRRQRRAARSHRRGDDRRRDARRRPRRARQDAPLRHRDDGLRHPPRVRPRRRRRRAEDREGRRVVRRAVTGAARRARSISTRARRPRSPARTRARSRRSTACAASPSSPSSSSTSPGRSPATIPRRPPDSSTSSPSSSTPSCGPAGRRQSLLRPLGLPHHAWPRERLEEAARHAHEDVLDAPRPPHLPALLRGDRRRHRRHARPRRAVGPGAVVLALHAELRPRVRP